MNTKLVVGLGNPGEKYENTYHNVGFLMIDYWLTAKNIYLEKNKKFPGEIIKDGDIIFMKPLTFMNNSGKAVGSALRFFKLAPAQMIVIHDDTDLPIGKFKIVFDSGSAGHHGVQSIIDQIGAKNFWRVKIGIRSPQEKTRKKAAVLVLKKISKTNLKILKKVFEEAWGLISDFLILN